MTPDVVIRVDASERIGTGHVHRMLVLAEMARSRQLQTAFFVRHLPPGLRERIRAGGFELHQLGHGTPESTQSWLGVSIEIEIAEMLDALNSLERRPRTIIVDHYEIDECWEAAMAATGARLFVIDDLADRRHHCDVLLDCTVGPPNRYEGLLSSGTHVLLGPPYALVRTQFVIERQKARVRSGKLRHVLVFYGGVDQTGESVKALRALRSIVGELQIDVIPGSSQIEAVQQTAVLDPRVRVQLQVDEWAALTAASDVVLGAGGTASWERCFVGTPSIATAIAENQLAVSARLAETGAICYLGAGKEVTENAIAGVLSTLRANPSMLQSMSEQSFALCAGYAEARREIANEL